MALDFKNTERMKKLISHLIISSFAAFLLVLNVSAQRNNFIIKENILKELKQYYRNKDYYKNSQYDKTSSVVEDSCATYCAYLIIEAIG